MTINSRQKGKRIELQAAKKLTETLGCSARRSQQYCGEAGDADLITDLPKTHIEVKGVERLNIYKAIEQAESDKKYHDIPIVIHKKNGKPFLLTMYLEDAGDFCENINDYRSSKEA